VKVLCIFFAAFLDGKQGVNDYSVVNIFNPPGEMASGSRNRKNPETGAIVQMHFCEDLVEVHINFPGVLPLSHAPIMEWQCRHLRNVLLQEIQ
jgi:hypothetical protein